MSNKSSSRTLYGSRGIVGLLVLGALLFAGCTSTQAPAKAPAAAATPTKAAVAAAATPTKAAAAAATPTKAAAAASQTMTETKTMTQTSTTKPATGGAMAPIVMVYTDAKLGQILVDSKGMVLYAFDNDAMDKSNCTGDCLKNWPALTVQDENMALTTGQGVTAKLSIIKRDDGSYQVAINGRPLYHYAKDTKADQASGQGVGSVWWVVGPDGKKITKQG